MQKHTRKHYVILHGINNLASLYVCFAGSIRASLIQSNPHTTLHCIVDEQEENARQMKLKMGLTCDVHSLQSLSKVLADSSLDGVCVCTPTHTHLSLIQLIAEHKKPIFVEKPVGGTCSEIDECFAHANRNNVPYVQRFSLIIINVAFCQSVRC